MVGNENNRNKNARIEAHKCKEKRGERLFFFIQLVL